MPERPRPSIDQLSYNQKELSADSLDVFLRIARYLTYDKKRKIHRGDEVASARYHGASPTSSVSVTVKHFLGEGPRKGEFQTQIENTVNPDSSYTVIIPLQGSIRVVSKNGDELPHSKVTEATQYMQEADKETSRLRTEKYVKEEQKRKEILIFEANDLSEAPQFSELREIEEEESRRVKSRLEMPDKPWIPNQLTGDVLQEAGLVPVFSQRLTENQTVYFSPIITSTGFKHPAVIAYMDRGDSVVPYVYYLSQSQAVWRYIPRSDEFGYDKGEGEDTLTLPIPIQESLATVFDKNIKAIPKELIQQILSMGNGRFDYNHLHLNLLTPNVSNFRSIGNSRSGRRDIFSEITSGQFDFEGLDFPDGEGQNADLTSSQRSWIGYSRLYGHVNYESFYSQDGSLEYLFAKDSEGRVWLATVDIRDANIRRCGIRNDSLDMGLLTTPALEYTAQTTGSDEDDGYVDVTSILHQHIPLLKRYREANSE